MYSRQQKKLDTSVNHREIKSNKDKHNAELQRTAPNTQDTEAFSTRGRLFFFLTFMFF